MELQQKTKELIKEQALLEDPKECCGFVLDNGDIIPCVNIAADPFINFIFIEKQPDNAVAYYHSHPPHPNDEDFNELDKKSASSSELPMVLYIIRLDEFKILTPDPEYIPPLEKRQFAWYISDCWTLAKDYYKINLGWQLSNGPLRRCNDDVVKSDLYGWMVNYLTNEEKKFVQIPNDSELIAGDLLMMALGANTCNHVAVYLGNNMIIHNIADKESCKSFYGSYWQKKVGKVLRPINNSV